MKDSDDKKLEINAEEHDEYSYLENMNDVAVGDILEFFTLKEQKRVF